MASKGFNQVLILGRLTREPELKDTGAGAMLRFSMAVNYQVKDNSGGWQDACEFITCVAWGSIASNIAKFCHKGSQLFVRGGVKTDSYQAADGSKKSSTYVRVIEASFLDGKNKAVGNSDRFNNTPDW